MLFKGSIAGFNWHRAFWLALAASAKLPIDVSVSNFVADGLTATASSHKYVQDLAEATCVLSFSMRPDLSQVCTGRTFETCLSGALLVQEEAANIDYYFVAGEHYLEFRNFAELCAIARFLLERPAEAEDVRRRGHLFARQHYNDARLIGSLDNHLAAQHSAPQSRVAS